ncbi:MAG TPA: hypothetical protein VIU12_17880 [Chryseolinea sp.]
MNLLKSTGAILAGFVFVVIISVATDVALEKTGIMKQPFDLNPVWFILFVILYRTVYGVVGTYITASLAPNNPMRHALISGFIGLAISIAGAIVMRDQGPSWYAISLVVLALPTAWLGGKLKEMKSLTPQ